jgi:hypothetical protein
MPKKKYIVSLTASERTILEQLTKKGKTAAYKIDLLQKSKIKSF